MSVPVKALWRLAGQASECRPALSRYRHTMIRDLRLILDGWEYEPGKISVRKIMGRDGTEKVQTRIDLGVLQMELDGHPDGKRPRGYESFFDYLKARLQHHIECYGSDSDFALTPEECLELRHETYLYYQRYLSLFVLEDYQRVLRDTARSLAVIDFCDKWAATHEDRQALVSQRPYVLMMHARAKAMLAMQRQNFQEALAAIAEGIAAIEAAARDPDCEYPQRELQTLSEVRTQIIEQMPEDAPVRLRWELELAVAQEDYERAAELRNRLAARPTDNS
jgi:hypothetical protein